MQATWLPLAGALLLALSPALPSIPGDEEEAWKAAFESITEDDLEAHLWRVAAPRNEGRDSPSSGMRLAADYIIDCFEQAGVAPGWEKGWRHRFTARPAGGFSKPDAANCGLVLSTEDGSVEAELEKDFVPFPGCDGRGGGEVVFLGFGIASKRYNDLGKRSYRNKVALILSGEPRHKRVLEGPVVSPFADAYAKVKELEDRGCSAVLIVRRAPPASEKKGNEELPPPPLAYRHTWGRWLGTAMTGWTAPKPRSEIPVAEVSEAFASRILGQDVAELAARIDKAGKSKRIELEDVSISLSTATVWNEGELEVDNVFGVVRGTDPELSKEYVVIGSHYDHVGVDHWGRIGYGADDNGSGTVANLELVQAFAAAPPRRTIVFAFFGAEEDGLIGSDAFADELPFLSDEERARTPSPVVAMLNMDMLGRGNDRECVVLGTKENPSLGKVLTQASKLGRTGVRKVTTGKAAHLWERSDHYSFHKREVPVLFFFEAPSEADNPDYHTYRDTIEGLSVPKIANSARLVFNTAWMIANDDDRPPAPR